MGHLRSPSPPPLENSRVMGPEPEEWPQAPPGACQQRIRSPPPIPPSGAPRPCHPHRGLSPRRPRARRRRDGGCCRRWRSGRRTWRGSAGRPGAPPAPPRPPPGRTPCRGTRAYTRPRPRRYALIHTQDPAHMRAHIDTHIYGYIYPATDEPNPITCRAPNHPLNHSTALAPGVSLRVTSQPQGGVKRGGRGH